MHKIFLTAIFGLAASAAVAEDKYCHPDGLWDIYVTNSHSARISQGYNQRSDCRMGGPHRYPELSQAMMQKIACDNGFEALVEIDPEDRMLVFFKDGGYIILEKCETN